MPGQGVVLPGQGVVLPITDPSSAQLQSLLQGGLANCQSYVNSLRKMRSSLNWCQGGSPFLLPARDSRAHSNLLGSTDPTV